MNKDFTALMILDGFGFRKEREGNAVALANTPNIDALFATYPHTLVGASGLNVGLPDGQMGNSEVGHLNIGAGRIVYQELTRVTKSIADGDFFEVPEFIDAMSSVKDKGALHLMGLMSDGGVHSHMDHALALVKMAKDQGVKDIFIHCFMDGRDVPPDSGKDFIIEFEKGLEKIGAGKIATVIGRYYAMDRDNRWERVSQAYNALVLGKGVPVKDAVAAMTKSYAEEEYDEFVKPSVIMQDGAPIGRIEKGDSVICFNFRPDRAREITRTLVDPEFNGFERELPGVKYVCLTQYDKTMPHVSVAFKPSGLQNTLGEYLAKLSVKQFRIAETEKYAHVSYSLTKSCNL